MLSSCVFSFGIVSMEYIFKYNFMLKYHHYYYYKIGIILDIQLGIPPFPLNITESRSFFYPCGDGVRHLLGVPYQSTPIGWCAPSLQGSYPHQEGNAPISTGIEVPALRTILDLALNICSFWLSSFIISPNQLVNVS